MVDFIKPSELPPASTVYDDDAIIVDNAGLVQKATPEQVVNAGAPVASQAEAIAGTDNTKRMTALRVRQVLDDETAPSVLRAQAWAEASGEPDPAIPGSRSSKSWAEDAETARDETVNAAPFAVKDAADFFSRTTLVVGARYWSKDGMAWDVVPPGSGDFNHPLTGDGLVVVPNDKVYASSFGYSASDATDYVRKAMLAANRDNADFVFDGAKTYVIKGPIEINRSGKSNLRIDLRGSTLLFEDEGRIEITGDGPFLETTLSNDVAKGDYILPLASSAGIEAGDLIEIESPAISLGSVNTVHTYVVAVNLAGVIYTTGPVVADITEQQVIDSGKSGPIVARVYHLCGGLRIENGCVDIVDPDGRLSPKMSVSQHVNPVVSGISFKGHARFHLYIMLGTGDLVDNCNFKWPGYAAEDNPYYANYPWQPDGLGYGYGLIHARNYQSTVRNCHGATGWHTFDVSRGQMYIDYFGCSTERDAYGFATHECSWYVSYYNCRTSGHSAFALARCIHPKVVGCTLNAAGGASNMTLSLACKSVHIEGTSFYRPSSATTSVFIYTDPAAAVGPGVSSAGDTVKWRLTGNLFDGPADVIVGAAGVGLVEELDNTFTRGARITMLGTVVSSGGSRHYDSIGTNQFNVTISATDIFVSNLSAYGTVGANGAVIRLNDKPTNVDIDGVKSYGNADYLCRIINTTDAIKVKRIVNCHNTNRILLGGSNVTVANFVNNTYGLVNPIFPTVSGPTVTSSVNNNLMVA